jgi:hypothetical protein
MGPDAVSGPDSPTVHPAIRVGAVNKHEGVGNGQDALSR